MPHISKKKYIPAGFPEKYCLPGYIGPWSGRLRHLYGPREVIVDALTRHGLPKEPDRRIESLPADVDLKFDKPLKRDYLSFLVYSLKQMVSAGTVSPDTAWDILLKQTDALITLKDKRFREEDFFEMRRGMLNYVKEKEAAVLAKGLRDISSMWEEDPIAVEFYIRAGKTGLNRYHDFITWMASFSVLSGCSSVSFPVRWQYRIAVWLEMRLVEESFGMRGPKYDIGGLIPERKGQFNPGDRDCFGCSIEGLVDIYKHNISPQSGMAVDSTILAEVGHWMGHPLYEKYTWIAELMDRMTMSRYTERVNGSFDRRAEVLTPEQLSWLTGGFFLSSVGEGFPVYPAEFPADYYPENFPFGNFEKHDVAEYVERLLRKRIIKAVKEGHICPDQAFQFYKKTALYIAFNAEMPKKWLFDAVRTLDIDQIQAAYEYMAYGRTGRQLGI